METPEFNSDDFDLDKLKNFQKKIIIESANFRTINQICKETLQFSRMVALIGETGYGKSNALEYFVQNNKNVYFLTVKKSMNAKNLYDGILKSAGWTNVYKESTLYHIIESIGYYLSQSEGKHLLILDESGKLNHRNLLYVHDLRDSTIKNTGIILSGPKYFEVNLRSDEHHQLEGIPELMRRINLWIELEPHSYAEKRELLIQHGFKNKTLLKSIATESKHLGEVYDIVCMYGIMYLRSVSEE